MRAPTDSQDLRDGGRLELWESWIRDSDAQRMLEKLQGELPWAQKNIQIMGRSVPQPRLTAWVGDAGAVYTYSGLTHTPSEWTPTLSALRQRLVAEIGYDFNSILANMYRHERDSMGWHADREKELGVNPVIASLSLGATRRFRLRHRTYKHLRVELALDNGSLLLMSGSIQHHWKHSVPKESRPIGPRINLTFRQILGQNDPSVQ